MKVAINGFGRIGRLVLKSLLEKKNVEVIAINDLTDVETLAHLLRYDSVHGKFPGKVEVDRKKLIVNGQRITVLSEKDPSTLPWDNLGIDVVVECTGQFRKREGASKHLEAGAKKVVISAPGSADIPMIVLGVNDELLEENHDILSNASCTTNCLAPLAKILDDEFGIEKGYMTTIHSYTSDQRLQDAPHKDLRRARAASLSMIPTTTGAAKAVGKVIPHLEGKLDGCAVRVPTPDGSMTDLTVVLKRETTVEEVNESVKKAAEGAMKEYVEYCTDPIVSVDIIGNKHSCIFDSEMTSANGNLVKVMAWYDNEMGYAQRLADLVTKLSA
ncbi:type I glyceraldehyde-3-phosphate dehydrogenase [Halocola ammonii]